jgi:hypothetical protein
VRRPITREHDDVTRERRVEPSQPLHPLLALQRGAGNAAVARFVESKRAGETEQTTDGQPLAPYYAWTKEEVRPIQRELKRLRLYKLGLDGILGKGSEMGLVEAFGGDEWRNLDAATTLTRLTAAERPKSGSGHDLRYGELFKDGLLDLTFGYGFMEELDATQWAQYAQDIEDALQARGYTEDAKRAAELYATAGRQTTGFGRFFVKEVALTYAPPAGPARPIPAIVRFIMNPGGDKGVEARQAFEQGMAQGDAAYYSGHGRYGSGPDFDRNFGKFTLLDENGKVEQVIDDYEVLGQVLAKEHGGGAWSRFLWRWDHGRIQVDFSNAGNLRLNAKNKHPEEFGGKLINWAMDQTGQTAATGADGELATQAAANPDRKYRVLVFDGCRTQDYEGAIRKTPGFDTKSADVIETRRTVGFGAEAEAFCAFLDGLVGQQSAEQVVKGMNEEMKGNEEGYAGAPYVGSGFGDNLSR